MKQNHLTVQNASINVISAVAIDAVIANAGTKTLFKKQCDPNPCKNMYEYSFLLIEKCK